MGRVARRPEPWLVLLGSISLIAWSALALDGGDFMPPPFCSTVSAWPPNRVPWAKSTPSASGVWISTSAPTTNDRFFVLTACHSDTGASPGK